MEKLCLGLLFLLGTMTDEATAANLNIDHHVNKKQQWHDNC